MKPLSYKQQLAVIEAAYKHHKKGGETFIGMCFYIRKVINIRYSRRVYSKDFTIDEFIPIFKYETLYKLGEQGYIPKLHSFYNKYVVSLNYWWMTSSKSLSDEREQVYLFLIDYLNKRTTLWKRIKLWYKRLL